MTAREILIEIGDTVHNYSFQKLADKCGCSSSNVQRILRAMKVEKRRLKPHSRSCGDNAAILGRYYAKTGKGFKTIMEAVIDSGSMKAFCYYAEVSRSTVRKRIIAETGRTFRAKGGTV